MLRRRLAIFAPLLVAATIWPATAAASQFPHRVKTSIERNFRGDYLSFYFPDTCRNSEKAAPGHIVFTVKRRGGKTVKVTADNQCSGFFDAFERRAQGDGWYLQTYGEEICKCIDLKFKTGETQTFEMDWQFKFRGHVVASAFVGAGAA